MRSNYKKLGDFISPQNYLNEGMEVTELLGISNQKYFQKSHTNINGMDFSTYRIVRTGQFAFNRATTRNGEKISIALRQGGDCIVSPSYRVFQVNDENELLSEYLLMWFKRPEFDRYVRFKSHGSAHEFFEYDQMCEVELPIPPIAKQREIVKEFNVIQDRINLNNRLIQKLEETAQAVYKQWFVEGIDKENLPEGWKIGVLSDLCSYSSNRISIQELSTETYISTENMLPERNGITLANNLPSVTTVNNFKSGDILISNIRPYFKKIWLANFEGGCSNDILCIVPNDHVPPQYLYQILEKDAFFEYVMAGSKGTKMPRGDKKWIMNYPTIIPNKKLLDDFTINVEAIRRNSLNRRNENLKLSEMKDLLLSKLATIGN